MAKAQENVVQERTWQKERVCNYVRNDYAANSVRKEQSCFSAHRPYVNGLRRQV